MRSKDDKGQEVDDNMKSGPTGESLHLNDNLTGQRFHGRRLARAHIVPAKFCAVVTF